MEQEISGIHHVTAIAGDPQRNIDFYTGLLGLRLVKLTVNFDDPGTYHFYYGDGQGSPGTLVTFFPWPGAPRGRTGTGQVTVTSFAVPEGSFAYWRERLPEHGVAPAETRSAFGDSLLAFPDPDGLQLELVETGGAAPGRPWEEGPVPAASAIRGLHRVTLSVEGYDRTAALLTETMGFRQAAARDNCFRFETGAGRAGSIVDLLCAPDAGPGRVAPGAVHHVAWRTPGEPQQLRWRAVLTSAHAYNVTPVIDRRYFRSIYFREPGGVLFEIATDAPGFTVDEPAAELGRRLQLPERHEPMRAELGRKLPPLRQIGRASCRERV